MKRSSHLVLFASILASGACVMSPNWGDDPTRRDPIDFDGVASQANASMRVQAWNHGLSAYETVASFVGTDDLRAVDPDIYAWQRLGVRLADRYWIPPGGSCRDPGMALLRVQEYKGNDTWSDLATFDQAGEDCVWERIADGSHPVGAGNACKRSEPTIVLFAPPQCVPAKTSGDSTAPGVTIRLMNSSSVVTATAAYERTSGQSDLTLSYLSRSSYLTAYGIARDLDGAVRNVEIAGDTRVVCRNTSNGTLTIYPFHVNASRSQTVTSGTYAEVSLETSRLINVPGLAASTCPSGWTFQEIQGTLFAAGTNAAGAVTVSPQIRFTVR